MDWFLKFHRIPICHLPAINCRACCTGQPVYNSSVLFIMSNLNYRTFAIKSCSGFWLADWQLCVGRKVSVIAPDPVRCCWNVVYSLKIVLKSCFRNNCVLAVVKLNILTELLHWLPVRVWPIKWLTGQLTAIVFSLWTMPIQQGCNKVETQG